MNQIQNMFGSLIFRIWILFVIYHLVLGIFSIQDLNWMKIYHTTLVTYLWDATLAAQPDHIICLPPPGVGHTFDLLQIASGDAANG